MNERGFALLSNQWMHLICYIITGRRYFFIEQALDVVQQCNDDTKARIFLLVDLREFFSDLGSGGRKKINKKVGGTKKINKKALKMTS